MQYSKIVIVTVLFIGLCSAISIIDKKKDPNSFDYFLMVQEWDSTVSQNFTIHGLWAENNDGSYPSFCPGSVFDITAINDLVPTMNVVWPSDTGNNTEFWDHEWSKHGTCSTFDIHTFFQDVLNLHFKLDLVTALAKSNIVPNSGSSFTQDQIIKAIQNYYGTVPTLKCDDTNLQEVAICVTKTLSLMDCPSSIGTDYFKCPETGIDFI